MTRGTSSTVRRLAAWVCTVGPLGHAPFAPGTFGAAAALPAAYLCVGRSPHVWAITSALLVVVAMWAVDAYLAGERAKDPQEIVVDEFVGCFLALSCVPVDWRWWLAAFLLFRGLDIRKPGFIGWCDRHLPGAWGVMLDDVLAGLGAGVLLACTARVVG